MFLSGQSYIVGTAVENCFADENEMHSGIYFFFFAIFPTKPFSHVPIIIFCFKRTSEPLSDAVTLSSVLQRRPRTFPQNQPQSAVWLIFGKKRTWSRLSQLRWQLFSVFSLETPELFDGAPKARSQPCSPEVQKVTCRARSPKAAFETFMTTPKHLQMCLERWWW